MGKQCEAVASDSDAINVPTRLRSPVAADLQSDAA